MATKKPNPFAKGSGRAAPFNGGPPTTGEGPPCPMCGGDHKRSQHARMGEGQDKKKKKQPSPAAKGGARY